MHLQKTAVSIWLKLANNFKSLVLLYIVLYLTFFDRVHISMFFVMDLSVIKFHLDDIKGKQQFISAQQQFISKQQYLLKPNKKQKVHKKNL